MEFYHVGKHCSHDGCNQLDFLPYKCAACTKVFCQDHWKFEQHSCPDAATYRPDRHVPECPICAAPVPCLLDEDPNLRMDRHIASGCKDLVVKSASGAAYTHQCHQDKCKKKELIPFKCSGCDNNYCVKHRLPTDHKCDQSATRSKSSKSRLLASPNSAASMATAAFGAVQGWLGSFGAANGTKRTDTRDEIEVEAY